MTEPSPGSGKTACARPAITRTHAGPAAEGSGQSRAERRGARSRPEFDRRSERLLWTYHSRFPDNDVLAEESRPTAEAQPGAGARLAPREGPRTSPTTIRSSACRSRPKVAGQLAAQARRCKTAAESVTAAWGRGARLNESDPGLDIERVEDAMLVTGFATTFASIRERVRRRGMWSASGLRPDGSAALNLCYLAMGRFDGFGRDTSRRGIAAACGRPRRGRNVTNYAGGGGQIEGGVLASTRNLRGGSARSSDTTSRHAIGSCESGTNSRVSSRARLRVRHRPLRHPPLPCDRGPWHGLGRYR